MIEKKLKEILKKEEREIILMEQSILNFYERFIKKINEIKKSLYE